MIIHRMKADFGVLKGAELELRPGLNVICAPNESGKSTWCAFLRTMLYGPDTSRRRNGEKPDRIRYAPWDGTPPSGLLELTHGGRGITLHRFTENSASPMRRFSAVYTGTGLPVSGLSESDAGEILTGVPQDVYRRTAFIRGEEMAVTTSAELEKKTAALLSAGEADASSYSEAANRLRSWERRCGYRGQGKLPELEQEIADLEGRIEAARAVREELDRAEITEEKARLLLDSLKETQRTLPKNTSAERERRKLEMQRQILNREREAQEIRISLREGPLRGQEPGRTAREKAASDAARARELRSRMKKALPSSAVTLVCLVLTILTAAAAFVHRQPIWLAPTAVCLCLGAGWRLYCRSAEKMRRADARELNAVLKRYSVSSPDEIEESFRRSEERWQESEALLAAASELQRELESLEKELPPADVKSDRLREAEQNWSRAAGNAARLRGRLDTMEEPAILVSELERAKQAQKIWTRRQKALALAQEILSQADEEMQMRFAPALTRRAEKILCQLTGGRYDSLALGRDLSASVGETDGVLRESGYLSHGALDQTYLAIRLALCRLLLNGEEPCPLVLDDALLTFDDERMGCAMDFLSELAKERQIILFTCQKREEEYLKTRKL